ncbi:hypothetical protein KI387_015070, partial [Taxus chinensis]
MVKRDISRGSRQKSVLENVHKTAALLRVAVTGPPPCSGRRSRDRRPCRAAVSLLKVQRPRKEGKRGKQRTRGLSGACGMLTHIRRALSGSRTPFEETCIIIGAFIKPLRSTVPYNFG